MNRFVLIALVLCFVFLGCNLEGNEEFIASTNDMVLNDTDTLGLTGTSVSSSNTNVATAEIVSGKIKITSIAEGEAVITVTDNSDNNATINVSVSKTGVITIGTINKFTGNENINVVKVYITYNEVDVIEYEGSGIISGFGVVSGVEYENFGHINNGTLDINLPASIPDEHLYGDIIKFDIFWFFMDNEQIFDLRLMNIDSTDIWSSKYAFFIYANDNGNLYDFFDNIVAVTKGWNIFEASMDREDFVENKLSDNLEDLYELGYKWVLLPTPPPPPPDDED